MPTIFPPEVLATLQERAPELFAYAMQKRADLGAKVWREICAKHPTADVLRAVAFDQTTDEAVETIRQLYPAARYAPGLREFIAALQEEMRRPR